MKSSRKSSKIALASFAMALAVGQMHAAEMSPSLMAAHKSFMNDTGADAEHAALMSDINLVEWDAEGYTPVDVVASGSTDDAVRALKAAGAKDITARGRLVSSRVPMAGIPALEASSAIKLARPALAARNVGLVTSQGDVAMRTNIVRERYSFDGSKTKVGIISDSFACDPGVSNSAGVYTTPAEDIANGDLPAEGVENLEDLPPGTAGCIDEGRAMAQLVHDVVPGAALSFHTAFLGEADFAQGIIDLAKAGADVIVDDIIYFAEPMFQDGAIAQSADIVALYGVPYFSSNGNRGRDAYESTFNSVSTTVGGIIGHWHNFDRFGAGTFKQRISLTNNGGPFYRVLLSFQWDQPNFSVSGPPGTANDVRLVMFDTAGNPVPNCFVDVSFDGLCQFNNTDGGGIGGDAIHTTVLVYLGTGTIEPTIGFVTLAGPPAGYVKYVPFGLDNGAFEQLNFVTNSGTGYGHNNAAHAEGVGAAWFGYTAAFVGDPYTLDLRGQAGELPCVPACLNDFSSAGGTPIFYDISGNRLAWPEIRLKPGVTGPDGTNNTFFRVDTFRDDDNKNGVFMSDEPGEFPNFFGTSASAPHVAAIAAMMYDGQDGHILTYKKNGDLRYRMCKPGNDGRTRYNGKNRRVKPEKVHDRLKRGWLLGPCHRFNPEEVYYAMRYTAEDMSVRADLSTGETIQIFDENPPAEGSRRGFDFDSGFGFVNANRAVNFILGNEDIGDDDIFGREE